jgi:hypothetical protein
MAHGNAGAAKVQWWLSCANSYTTMTLREQKPKKYCIIRNILSLPHQSGRTLGLGLTSKSKNLYGGAVSSIVVADIYPADVTSSKLHRGYSGSAYHFHQVHY